MRGKGGFGQGDQAREEKRKESFELTAKEAKWAKKEWDSEDLLSSATTRLIAINWMDKEISLFSLFSRLKRFLA